MLCQPPAEQPTESKLSQPPAEQPTESKLVDLARRLAEPAEKLLTHSFRFAGWVVGRAAGPVFSFVGTTSRPVVRTLSALSPIAAEKIWRLLPLTGPRLRPEAVVVPPQQPARPPNVATVPPPTGAPSPAAAHAEANALLAEAGPARTAATAAHDDLPLAGWDGLTIAAIRQRTRTLGAADILALLAYERAHAARPAVILNLENRLAKLPHANGAQPAQA